MDLARSGATIIAAGPLPSDVPGLDRLDERRREFKALMGGLNWADIPGSSARRAPLGRGGFVTGPDLPEILRAARIPRETMADAGLRCIRRRRAGGADYFVVNSTSRPWDGWVTLGTPAACAAILDPLQSAHTGVAALRRDRDGAPQVRLQLGPGESRILRTFSLPVLGGPGWFYEGTPYGTASRVIAGTWTVHFLEGGPVLPQDYSTPAPGSWAARDDPEARRFAGTAVYRIEFDFQPGDAKDWRLDLGRVCESARVRVNGHDARTLWCPPFAANVGAWLRPGRNVLEVEVTNLAANRIADMDRRHVAWKIFYEINFVNRAYKPFDASGWPARDSGLIGPVRLTPLEPAPAP